MRWEYLWLQMATDGCTASDGRTWPASIGRATVMAELGGEGWDLVGVTDHLPGAPNMPERGGMATGWFKRPVQGD